MGPARVTLMLEPKLEEAFLAVERGTQGSWMSPAQPRPLREAFGGSGAAEGLPAPAPLPGKQVPRALEEQGGGTAGAGLLFLVIGSREFPGRGLLPV